jgi:hypothetical protein
MKRTLMIFGGIFAAIIIALVIYFAYFFIFIGPVLDKESKAWVDEIVPKIVATWDVDKLVKNGSSEFLNTVSREEIEKLFFTLSTELGTLEKYNGSKGEAGIEIHNGQKTTRAKYLAEADFVKRSAEINVQGIKEKGVWKISGFYVRL